MNTRQLSLSNSHSQSRREFLLTTGTAAGATLLATSPSRAAAGTGRIRLGLIGCGGRGRWIANLFQKHGGYELSAVADYFQDRVDQVSTEHGVPANRRFTGLYATQRMLDVTPLDAVAIESPPFFHPEQAAAAVRAGKHVYLAKPAAVDVPGCQSIQESADRARASGLSFLIDFQMPTLPVFQSAAAQIKNGDLGTIISAEASYQTGLVGEAVDRARRANPENPELRLRAWVTDRALSGDVITEQNVHAVDMLCRLLDAAPLRAQGTGGKTREFVGDCWDHFALLFEFPGGITATFSSKQVGFGYDDICCRVYGTNGTADMHYAGKSVVRFKEDGTSATSLNLYTTGAEANIAAFHNSIRTKETSNATVGPGIRSNLACILGRIAAYRRRTVSWEEMLQENERLLPRLEGLKS